jgi:hypothetical protein
MPTHPSWPPSARCPAPARRRWCNRSAAPPPPPLTSPHHHQPTPYPRLGRPPPLYMRSRLVFPLRAAAIFFTLDSRPSCDSQRIHLASCAAADRAHAAAVLVAAGDAVSALADQRRPAEGVFLPAAQRHPSTRAGSADAAACLSSAAFRFMARLCRRLRSWLGVGRCRASGWLAWLAWLAWSAWLAWLARRARLAWLACLRCSRRFSRWRMP